MATNKLPDKLWECLELAMQDLEKCEADPKYEIDMDRWYARPPRSTKCHVCLAGSVMAQRLDAKFFSNKPSEYNSERAVEPDDYSPEVSRKLTALNYLREGNVETALSEFYPYPSPHYEDHSWILYGYTESCNLDEMSSDSRKEWKDHMAVILGVLKAENL